MQAVDQSRAIVIVIRRAKWTGGERAEGSQSGDPFARNPALDSPGIGDHSPGSDRSRITGDGAAGRSRQDFGTFPTVPAPGWANIFPDG